ncbi:glycosyltransferase family 4 protein [Liquorilactobacillus satsumensis]|uniref:glycosyltransferase family 4 protein n=1 Tax=Liquorilactobacillus satsumensis TaxID=259059 RepID=UPI001E3CE37C|nr:glycosyltransferase family 4 protein [Liquorilactobacillus satsumensis]MCC7666492.1 glycosyltransferase [Liquorilactobacillus satsumensis]MCP9357542.1 glycosyltransferase family 4 protein [Liquorilactobacillus satsumensis]MCP9371370.1 glycosyltransferase family 4 protein [Liquorilactobacillus satsumensis]
MLRIHMFSSATKIKGQGVGSAYTELIKLLQKHFADKIQVSINKLGVADISHYHTIDFKFFLSTFLPGRGRKIGYVHFLPETLEGSLKIPQPFKQIFFWYLITFYKRMDHLVVVNPCFIKDLERYGIARENITYIPNFVSKTEFHELTPARKKALRQKYGIAQGRFTIIGTGQVQERKGVPDFIELARRLPQFQFVWVGGFSFGKMTDGYTQLKKVVADPPTNLLFPGIVEREQMNAFYNLADVFLLPSFNELFPMSVLEAFSCGVPVVLRDLELYRAIIAGHYLAGKNVAEFEMCLKKLADQPQLLKQLHEKSLEEAKYYSEDNLAAIWYDFYREQTETV